jgi:hypothetical protein
MPTNPWLGGVLLVITDHIQGYVRLNTQSILRVVGVSLGMTDMRID